MGKIGLIDNELSTRLRHSFPNLAIMKLSAWHKANNDSVRLVNFDIINPNSLFKEDFDKIYISKVFSDTYTPEFINNMPNVIKGGSGFFYDLAEKLPNEIEHSKPDYELYKKYKGDYYNNFSIGFITRGCIRQCPFCINRNYKKVEFHSNPIEFIDDKKPFIMLLDDNITAYKDFELVFEILNSTGKPFVFKQGMDFRLLTLKKMQILWKSNILSTSNTEKKQQIFIRNFHFAFDNIKDYEIIKSKLLIYNENKIYNHNIMFYVLVGFDRENKYDITFFKFDIFSLLKRIELLLSNGAKPYIMVHENYIKSPYSEHIKAIKDLCNYFVKIASINFGDALVKDGKIKTYLFIKENYNEFLNMRFNYLKKIK